jgi:hypothetical protein
MQVGRYLEAKQALSTAILLVPEHAGAYSNLGSTLCAQPPSRKQNQSPEFLAQIQHA